MGPKIKITEEAILQAALDITREGEEGEALEWKNSFVRFQDFPCAVK